MKPSKSHISSKFTIIGIVLAVFFIHVIAFRGVWTNYHPWFDNIPVIVYSTPISETSWTHWFREGYQNYFDAYPGWPHAGTPFVRPAINVLFRIVYAAFGTSWHWYLLVNYLIQAIGVGLNWYILAQILRVRLPMTLLGLMATAVSAATQMAWIHPSYITDVLAGVLVTCAFLASRGSRLRDTAFAAAFLVAAVCAKETAIVGVFALMAQTCFRYFDKREKKSLLGHLVISSIPLLLWVFFRWVGPHNPAGAYPLQKLQELNVLDALIHWPSIVLSGITAARAKTAYPLLMLLNIGLMIALLSLLVRKIYRGNTGIQSGVVWELGLWCGAWILLLIFLPPEGRHGYGLVLLGIPLICFGIDRVTQKWLRRVAMMLLVGSTLIAGRTALMLVYQASETGTFQGRYSVARELVEQLRDADKNHCESVYVLHNVVEYGSAEALRLFAGIKAKVVNLTTLDGNIIDSRMDAKAYTTATDSGDLIAFDSVIPDQLHFIFEVASLTEDQSVVREEGIRYEFPHAKGIADLGNQVQINLYKRSDKGCLVSYNFGTGHYRMTIFRGSSRNRVDGKGGTT